MESVLTKSAKATETFGSEFAKKILSKKPDFVRILLIGPLGAGKTAFTKGLAEGLEVPKDILIHSPTFGLLHEYTGGKMPLFHADLYRVEKIEEFENLAFEDYEERGGILVVEWADRFFNLWPNDSIICRFEKKSKQTRKILIGQKREF